MGQDLRQLFKEDREKNKPQIKAGHEQRFLERLEKELPQPKKTINVLFLTKMVACLVLIVGLVSYLLITRKTDEGNQHPQVVEQSRTTEQEGISLGDLSPDLKKVENYYVANINLTLSQLEISSANKDVVDSFMEELESLDVEYKRLTKELNEVGPNEDTIAALITNFQIRLELLYKLQDKLNQIKSSKSKSSKNETVV